MGRTLVFTIIFTALSGQCFATGLGLLRSGNDAYENQKYGIAFDYYQKAAESGTKAYGSYNSGAALFRLKDYSNAVKAYTEAAELEPKIKEDALFNAGNAYYPVNKAGAADAFRKAYLLNTKDEAALHNLQYTIEEQQKDKKQDKDKDNNDNKNNNNQNNKNNNNNNNKDKNGQEDKKEDSQQPNISKEEAESVLQMLREQGNNVLAPLSDPKPETVDKDW